jgi:hypothetical protein
MSRTRRRLRRISFEGIRFIQNWMDAYDAELSLEEFCDMHDTTPNTVYASRFRMRQRGIELPMLAGMRQQPRRLKAADPPQCESVITTAMADLAPHTFQCEVYC